jgi:hypothetical protein
LRRGQGDEREGEMKRRKGREDEESEEMKTVER